MTKKFTLWSPSAIGPIYRDSKGIMYLYDMAHHTMTSIDKKHPHRMYYVEERKLKEVV
jgi:hypothetical protein